MGGPYFRSVCGSCALAGVLSLCALVLPQNVAAEETFDVLIVTPRPTGTGDNEVIELHDGDVVPSGGLFGIVINPASSGRLLVHLIGGDGKKTVLFPETTVHEGKQIWLPSRTEWFSLDDNPGIEKITVSFSGADGTTSNIVRHLTHISKDAFKLGKNVGDPENPFNPSEQTSVRKQITYGFANVPAVGSFFERIDAPIKAIGNLRGETPLIYRGSIGANIYKAFAPGVVLIVTNTGNGSGSIIRKNGLVLTNWHVVEGYESVKIIFKPPLGSKIRASDFYVGIVERVDQVADLALVRVVAPPRNLTAIPLGKFDDVEIGSEVHAIGHPTGEMWTYTKGTVSQVRPDYEWPASPGVKHKATVIQTQTPMNPGSSGGPLLTDSGRIIGVNSFIKTASQGINFAVSVKDVQHLLASKGSRKLLRGTKKSGTQRTKKSGTQKKSKKCKPPSDTLDLNKNGKPDAVRYDKNCDGRVDMIVFDSDEDGETDLVFMDTDHNGKVDIKVIPSKPGGPLAIWLIDRNGDGIPDVVGYDTNGDGKPDRYQVLNPLTG